jgi:hypothetical protein
VLSLIDVNVAMASDDAATFSTAVLQTNHGHDAFTTIDFSAIKKLWVGVTFLLKLDTCFCGVKMEESIFQECPFFT